MEEARQHSAVSELWVRAAIWLAGLSAASLFLGWVLRRAYIGGGLYWTIRREERPYLYWRTFIALSLILSILLGAIFAIIGALSIRTLR
jgi:hypothetical protein